MDVATSVPLNARLSATFDMAMAPLTTSTFTLKQGTTDVAGAVANSADATSATFTPSANLALSTVFTATITTSARSAAGAALATARSWSFTTGTEADTTAPRVTTTNPAADRTEVAINSRITATFSEPLDPLTVNSSTFTVKQGTAAVSGNVVYGPGTTATFTPANALASNALLTAALTTGVKDLSGNPLAQAFTWSFTTGATTARGPAPVLLGTAGDYAILAKAGVSTVPTSAVTGDIGLSPAAATYLTGFEPLANDSTNVFATSPQIVGRAYAADFAVPTPSNLTTAVSNMESAYTDAAGRPTPDFLELGTGNIGGLTLQPGLYKWTSSVTLPENVTLSGGANDVWIFQTTGDLFMSAAKSMTLSGEAQAKNIFWQVQGTTTLGAGAHFEGILLCKTGVTLETGATMNGRILSQTEVALQQATLTQPAQ
ncbi:MAG: ice-binding family protein [Myxococcota bacterium]|nr:ice-binding family protein [Myxococcota bacterium]